MQWADKQAAMSTVPSTVELGEMRLHAATSANNKDELSNRNEIERQGLINPSNQHLPKSILIEAIDQATKFEI